MRCGSWQHPSAWASVDNSVSVWCPSMQAVVAQVALPCIRETSPSSSSAVLCNTHDGNGSVWTTNSSILQGTDLDSEYTLCKFVCFLIKGGAAVPPPPHCPCPMWWQSIWTVGCLVHSYCCGSTKLHNWTAYVHGRLYCCRVVSPPIGDDFHSFILLVLDYFQLICDVTDDYNSQQQASKLAIQS